MACTTKRANIHEPPSTGEKTGESSHKGNQKIIRLRQHHTTLKKSETQLYFYSYAYNHTNPSRKWSFLKSSSNRRNFKTLAFRLRVDGDLLKTKLFENDDVTIITWFPWPSFPQTQIQNFKIRCCVFSVRPLWNRPHQKQKLFLTPSLKLLFNCSVSTKTAWILRHTRAAFELRVSLVVYADGLCNKMFTYTKDEGNAFRFQKEKLLIEYWSLSHVKP